MTKLFLRVKRGDAWLTLEIEQLTREELMDRFGLFDRADLVSLVAILCTTIRHNEASAILRVPPAPFQAAEPVIA